MGSRDTQAAILAEKKFEEQFKTVGSFSRDKKRLYKLIKKFRSIGAVNPNSLEREIVDYLCKYNNFTEYKNQKGHKRLCEGKNEDIKARETAAQEYIEFAKKIPSEVQIDRRFLNGLYKIYKTTGHKSSSDYMSQLVKNRLEGINPSLINDGDTTRVLILKQFLSELDFMKNTPFYDNGFKDYLLKNGYITENEKGTDFSKISDNIFSVLLDRKKEQSKSLSVYKLINLIKYYGYFFPCDSTTLNLLKEVFKTECLSSEGSFESVCQAFNCDIFRLTAENIEETAETTEIEQLCNILEKLRKSVFGGETVNANRFPAEYRYSVLCTHYPDIVLKKEVISLIRSAVPNEYLNSDYASGEKLSDILNCEAMKLISHSEVEKKWDTAEAKIANNKLLKQIESNIKNYDSVIKIKTDGGKTGKYANAVIKYAVIFATNRNSKCSASLLADSMKKNILQLPGDSCSVTEIAAVIKDVLQKAGLSFDESDAIVGEALAESATDRYVAALEDKVNERYKESNKHYKQKDEQPICGKQILKMTDELARGYFDAQKTTREKLYLFAVAFKMTFYSGAVNEKYDPDSDIQKNLFYDYYADNLINSITSGTSIQSAESKSKNEKTEKEVNGYGINLKNFAEIIFLYYLRTSLTSTEKIRKIYSAIDYCKKNGKAKEQLRKERIDLIERQTIYYKDALLSSVMSYSESDLLQYLIENYVCVSNNSVFCSSQEQRTAQLIYKELIKKVSELESKVLEPLLESYKDTLMMDSSAAFEYFGKPPNASDEAKLYDKVKEMTLKSMWMVTSYKWKDEIINDFSFYSLLENINEKLRDAIMGVEDQSVKGKAGSTTVSRTSIIALYYYYIILYSQYDKSIDADVDESSYDDSDDDLFYSFESYYHYMLENSIDIRIGNETYNGLNSCLAASGYQEINPKNIFDIFVIFLAFKYYFNINFNTEENIDFTEGIKISNYYAYTKMGVNRHENQDYYLHKENQFVEIIVLADGVSSCKEGKTGASVSCQTAADIMLNKWNYLFASDKDTVVRLIVNRVIDNLKSECTKSGKTLNDYSSTLSFACLDKNNRRLMVFSLGDSFIYKLSENELRLMYQPKELEDNHCYTTTTKAVEKEVYLNILDSAGIDSVILCSDGAWNLFYDQNIIKEDFMTAFINKNFNAVKNYLCEIENPDDCTFIVMNIKNNIS